MTLHIGIFWGFCTLLYCYSASPPSPLQLNKVTLPLPHNYIHTCLCHDCRISSTHFLGTKSDGFGRINRKTFLDAVGTLIDEMK